jgi:hypothetical protein
LEKYNQGNNTLLLYTDFVTVGESGNYSTYRDVSQRIDQSLHSALGFEKSRYYIAPNRSLELMRDSVETLADWGIDSLALGSIGYMLFSDYKTISDPIDRAEAAALYESALASDAMEWAVYRANAYLLAYTSKYLAVPTTSSGYAIYTDTVPFVAMLLAGAIEAYGPYANFFANRNEETLTLVDYGLLPSFILTSASAYQLNDTELVNLYSSSYETWSETVQEIYDRVSGALSAFYGERVVSRSVPRAGVVVTCYANGVSVIVNHSITAWTDGITIVDAASYRVVMSHE